MVADIKTNNDIAFDIENGTEIGLDGDGIDSPAKLGGQAVNLVSSQSSVKRIFLKDVEGNPR
jgi:hypothetical protein